MSGRRHHPPHHTTPHGVASVPTVSGEYRILAPRSAGRELGDLELDISDETDDALELECVPSSHQARGPGSVPMLPPALERHEQPDRRGVEGPRSSRSLGSPQHAIDPHAALVAFAGFGDPPDSFWGAPAYALRVLHRRRVLRAALARARSLRSHDVALYEAALVAADPAAVRTGFLVGLTAVAIVVAICAQAITGVLVLPW